MINGSRGMFTLEPVLKVEVVGPFGRELIRPRNETAEVFCLLLKQKTLTREDIQTIKRLGFKIVAEYKETEEL